jgi:hypothetical protein
MKTNSGRLTLVRSKRMDASLKSKTQIETNGDAIPVNLAGPGSIPGLVRGGTKNEHSNPRGRDERQFDFQPAKIAGK